MAIGGVISNRSFGSFLSPGRVCQKSNGIARIRKEEFGLSIGLYGQGQVLQRMSHHLTKNCFSSKCSYCSLLCIVNASEWRSSRNTVKAYDDQGHLFSHFQHANEQFCGSSSAKTVRRLSRCSTSMNSCHRRSRLAPLGTIEKFPVNKSKSVPLSHARNIGDRAYYKSEEFDITEASLESFRPPEGANEILPDVNAQKTRPWSERVPKRWVIVLLCFAAFLLCNMDRVNMSIAILPIDRKSVV